MMPTRTGANGSLAAVSAAQASAGCGWVPWSPSGPQVRVQRRGVAWRDAATVIVSEDEPGLDAPDPGPAGLPAAVWLPHAAASAATAPRAAATRASRRMPGG